MYAKTMCFLALISFSIVHHFLNSKYTLRSITGVSKCKSPGAQTINHGAHIFRLTNVSKKLSSVGTIIFFFYPFWRPLLDYGERH